jgi:hypothetical protein
VVEEPEDQVVDGELVLRGASAIGQPLGDEPFVLAPGDGTTEFAEVEIAAVEPDDGLTGTVLRGLRDVVWISHGTNLEVRSSVDY